MYCVRIMAAAARDAVLPSQLGLNLRRELRPVRFPVFLILEIVRELHEDVTHTGTDMSIRFDEPVGRRDVAVCTSCDDSLAIAPMLRVLEVVICRLEHHRVARGAAKSIRGGGVVDESADNNGNRAGHGARDQYPNKWPSVDLHN